MVREVAYGTSSCWGVLPLASEHAVHECIEYRNDCRQVTIQPAGTCGSPWFLHSTCFYHVSELSTLPHGDPFELSGSWRQVCRLPPICNASDGETHKIQARLRAIPDVPGLKGRWILGSAQPSHWICDAPLWRNLASAHSHARAAPRSYGPCIRELQGTLEPQAAISARDVQPLLVADNIAQ